MNKIKDNYTKQEITYIVGKYQKSNDNWYSQYEYEEIENAYAKAKELRNKQPQIYRYEVFERIKMEYMNIIHDNYLEG